MILPLVAPGDPILRRVLTPFDFNSGEDAEELARNLSETMTDRGAVGLAANQVGIDRRVFVMWGSPVIAVFNPRVVDVSEAVSTSEEACVSFPGLVLKVTRPKGIRVRFETPYGNTLTRRFEGMTARIFMHEMEHVYGGLFFQDASRPRLEMAIKKAKKLGFHYTYHDLMGRKPQEQQRKAANG